MGTGLRVLRRFGSRDASISLLSWSWSVVRGRPVHRCGAVVGRRPIPSVAVRWPSPLPPRPLPVTGSVLGVFPRGSGRAGTSPRTVPSSTWLLLQSSPSALGLGPPLLAPSASASPPTWALASTPGFPRGFPSVGTLPRVRSRSTSVVLHHPGGFLRSSFAGLFRPAAGPRFTVFQPGLALRFARSLLTARLVPFEECPSSTAVQRHRCPCPPVVSATPRPCSPPSRSASRSLAPRRSQG
jgi:hypothetical protein